MWMKSTGCLYYDCPSVKSRTKMRAVHRTLPGNCLSCRPTGWRVWFIQHAFKLENVILSISLHKCQHPRCLSFCWFFPPYFFFFLPCSEPAFNSLCALTDTLLWATLLSSCVSRFGGGWRRVKGEGSALCSVLSGPPSTQPLLCNTISPGSYLKGRWGWWGEVKTVN